MTATRYLIAPLAGAVLAAAGCGSTSTGSTTKHAGHENMPMTHTGTTMAMGHASGLTVAGMVRMTPPAPHAEVVVGSSRHYGKVLYDKDHFVLYVFSADPAATSTCYGACSSPHGGWPPLLTKGAPQVAGLRQSLLGTTRRRDGSLQVTYGGHPLYYWSGDTAHTIMCQHVQLHGGFWYVVTPGGTPNTARGIGTMSMM
jgi:predicted lipoprotein with Yx(FWY)xxD motif